MGEARALLVLALALELQHRDGKATKKREISFPKKKILINPSKPDSHRQKIQLTSPGWRVKIVQINPRDEMANADQIQQEGEG